MQGISEKKVTKFCSAAEGSLPPFLFRFPEPPKKFFDSLPYFRVL